MKHRFLIALVTVLAATVGHAADDVTIDGVTYEWYANSTTHQYGYVAAGWDEQSPIQSLHIRNTIDGYEVFAIKAGAFEDNDDIVYLTIDEGITSIGENAFCRCSNLKVAILPEGLETISEEAFAFCSALTTMVIPSTVTNIQAHAFSGCTGVTDVYFLMETEEQLGDFDWWDGVYASPGEEEHGGMEFNTNESTIVHVPAGTYDAYDQSGKLEAWLGKVQQDDGCYPLWWIVNYGIVGNDYTVSDDLAAVYVDIDGGLYVKDDNHWLTPDAFYLGEVDYMKNSGLLNGQSSIYDQSNWVMLSNIENHVTLELKGHHIAGGSITGRLLDKKNPTIEVSAQATLAPGDEFHFSPNIYIAAAFMGRTQPGADGNVYAFVQPKPQELIHVEWAIYNDDDECFYLPAPEEGINVKELVGGVTPSFELYEGEVPELTDGGLYAFNAVNRRIVANQESPAPRRLSIPHVDGGKSDTFMVYPIQLDSEIITGVPDISASTGHTTDYWYSIDGRNLGTDRPTVPGLYINAGHKVTIR